MTSTMTARQLGFTPFANASPVELRNNWTEDDVQAVINAAYRQVFGNEHLMSSERVVSAESLLRRGNITVREFIRALAQSETYRNKFFYTTPQVRLIELNCKHLLGRAPVDEAEIAEHVNRYTDQGYEQDINSYIDSEEYCDCFGDNTVPYYRGFDTQRGQTTLGFTRMFELYKGYANSDRSQGKNKGAALTNGLAKNLANRISGPAFGKSLAGTFSDDQHSVYRVQVMQAARSTRKPQVRRSMAEYLVTYDQLSPTLQRLNQRGYQIMGITPA